jgi:Arc/MetJ-type ribon-helix-helix transcriptional regulator
MQGVFMLDRILNLPPDVDEFVLSSVESGRFESTSALVTAALIAFRREQRVHANKHLASAIAQDDVFRKLWEAAPESACSLSRR